MDHKAPIHNPFAGGAVQQPLASPLLELAANYPFYTQQHPPNTFIPDAQMLFHVLGICDHMMNYTHHFLLSTPAWLPIVSQLYISILWNVAILRVSSISTQISPMLNILIDHLQIDQCMIPGPLVPFFQSLAAVKAPCPSMGDILPTLPDFSSAWNTASFHPINNIARILPIPAIMLDQLYAFSSFPIHVDQTTTYTTFEWYRCIFSQGVGSHNLLLRMGPQLCGSLFTTQAQFHAARNIWSSILANGFTRINSRGTGLTSYFQLFGFVSQDNVEQIDWFQHIVIVMQKYARYFKDSVPLKSVLTNGIGAVAIVGRPNFDVNVCNWIYPTAAMIEPFLTSRFNPRREIPDELRVVFSHSYREYEEEDEQYAVLTHTNMCWASGFQVQNGFDAIDESILHQGDYWNMTPFRYSCPVGLKIQFSLMIASRYHQQDE